MKQINSNMQHNNTWVKGMAILSLSVALQAKSCSGGGGGTMTYTAQHTTIQEFLADLNDRNDISRQVGGIDLLHAAVASGEVEKVKAVLKRINTDQVAGVFYKSNAAFPNSVDKNGKTALIKAIEKGNVKIAQSLVNQIGIDATIQDRTTGATPLHLAIEHGLDALVADLIAKLQVKDVVVADKKSRTPLHLAARGNKTKEFSALCDKISKTNTDILPHLLAKDSAGRSVFASAYLPKNARMGGILTRGDDAMFKSVLDAVKAKLTASAYPKIEEEIDVLARKGAIKPERTLQLRNILKKSEPNSV
jgi:ankyrin repeat protein